jgi:hypothetical protein
MSKRYMPTMTKHVHRVGSVAHQPSGFHGRAIRINGRNLVPRGQCDKLPTVALEKLVGSDKENFVRAFVRKARKGRVDLVAGACLENPGSQSVGVGSVLNASQCSVRTRTISWINKNSYASGVRHQRMQEFQPLADTSRAKYWMPVTLPPGRAKLATRPVLTGSVPTLKTIGIIAVAPFAVAMRVLLSVVMTATRWRTMSAISNGSRSN